MEQLATRCPQCDTRFRVTMAQLELRAGQVRCGACRCVFNGIDTLFEHHAEDTTVDTTPASQDISDRMTLIDFGTGTNAPAAPAATSMQDELDALSRAIADLQSKPWSAPPATPQSELVGEDDAPDHGEPASDPASQTSPAEPMFVQQAKRRQQRARTWTILLWIGIPLLLLSLAAQLVHYFRHDIAARSPFAAPYLRAACAELGCTIRLPMQIDRLSLVSSRLDATSIDSGRFLLVVVLRNQGDTVQAWPSIDLQLKNEARELIVRRAFLPGQYATADEVSTGMPARSEREIRLPFELAGEPPAGFELTIFHH